MNYRAVSYTRHTPDLIIKDTHRGLWYEDGRLTRILEAGRYEYPRPRLFGRAPLVEVVLVDMREQNMIVQDQDILTADRVAIQVSLVARYRVIDPKAAVHEVEDYQTQVYVDVQLAARRALASLTLDEILVSRSKINREILSDARQSAAYYGVEINRADVRDVILPASQEAAINPMLQPERLLEAQLLVATLAEIEHIQAQIHAETVRRQTKVEQEIERSQGRSQIPGSGERGPAAVLYGEQPVMLRLGALEVQPDLSHLMAARLFWNLDSNGKQDETK